MKRTGAPSFFKRTRGVGQSRQPLGLHAARGGADKQAIVGLSGLRTGREQAHVHARAEDEMELFGGDEAVLYQIVPILLVLDDELGGRESGEQK